MKKSQKLLVAAGGIVTVLFMIVGCANSSTPTAPATASSAASATPTPTATPTPSPTPTTAPPTTVPPTTAPPPPPTAAPAAHCYPLSNEGTCYEPGEYCRDADHGASGIAGDGEAITCEDNDGWRWEPA